MLVLPQSLRRNGTVTGGMYLVYGVCMFSVKFLIDHTVARLIFHRDWSLLDYITPGTSVLGLLSDPQRRPFYLAMFLVALPFVYVGLVLTANRLRGAGLPAWLVLMSPDSNTSTVDAGSVQLCR